MGQPCSREEGEGPISFLTGTTGKPTKSSDDLRDVYRPPSASDAETRHRRRRQRVSGSSQHPSRQGSEASQSTLTTEGLHHSGVHGTRELARSQSATSSTTPPTSPQASDPRSSTAGTTLQRVATGDIPFPQSGPNSAATNVTSNSSPAGYPTTTIPPAIGSATQPATGRFAPLTKGAWVLGPTEDINIRYELGNEPVGEPGSFGKVVKAKCRETGVEFACKIIPKVKFAMKWDGLAQFKREVKIMKMLRHPNIIQYHDFFEDSVYFYILMELCTGGELIHSDVRGVYSEEDASRLLRQMVSAVAYMHSMKLVHCDLKPDNFLFVSSKPDSPIKLIDFGLSKFIAHRGHFTAATGTPYFIAPEVLVGAYNQSCDLWSLGVVMFIMLFGFPPFDVRREERAADTRAADKKIFQKILRGFDPRVLPGAGAHFPSELPVSDSARDLIARLLTTDSGKRLTAEEALNHPWLQGVTATKTHLDPLVLKAMRTFDMQCKFQQAVLHLMVDWLNDVSLQQLQSTFSALDTNGDGFISIQDLRTAMKAFYAEQQERDEGKSATSHLAIEHIPDDDDDESQDKDETKNDSANTTEEMIESEAFWELEVQQIMRRVDINNDGYISYEDLLLSYVSMTLSEKEERMWAAFSKLDVDNSGRVDLEDLTAALNSKGLYDVEEMRVMLNEVDVDEDGMVEFEDFLEIMWQKHRSYLEDQKQRIQQKADRKRAKRQQERAERRGKAAAAAAAAAAASSANGESPRPSIASSSGGHTPVLGTPSFFPGGSSGVSGFHTMPAGVAMSAGSGPSREGSPVPSLSISGTTTPVLQAQPHSPHVLHSSAAGASLGALRLSRHSSGTNTVPSSHCTQPVRPGAISPAADVHRSVFGLPRGHATSAQTTISPRDFATVDVGTTDDSDVSMPIPFPDLSQVPLVDKAPSAIQEGQSNSVPKHETIPVAGSVPIHPPHAPVPNPSRLVAVPETRAITPPLVPVAAPTNAGTAIGTGSGAGTGSASAHGAVAATTVPAPVYVPPVVLAAAAAGTMSQKATTSTSPHDTTSQTNGNSHSGGIAASNPGTTPSSSTTTTSEVAATPATTASGIDSVPGSSPKSQQGSSEEEYVRKREEGATGTSSLSAFVPFPPMMTPVEAAHTMGLNAPVVSASITKPLRGSQVQHHTTKPPGATAAAVAAAAASSSGAALATSQSPPTSSTSSATTTASQTNGVKK